MSAVPREAPLTKLEKLKALGTLSKQLDKDHGTQNTLIRLGDKVGIPIPSYGTGLPTVDNDVIQCGGIPKGRIIEIFGPESAGKTTVTLHIVGQVQKAGGVAAFVDAEHALDPSYAATLGVNVEDLIVNQPDNGEQGLQVVDALIDSRAVDIIIIDSVSALVPKAELEGEIGDAHVGLQARMMSQTLRIITGKAAKNGVTVIFINQIREKIGVMFGNPETTTGGRALKFYSSLRLDVRRVYKSEIKQGDVIIGHRIKIKAVKNKVGSPFRETDVALVYEGGIDTDDDVISYALNHGIVTANGAWYSFNGERVGQGKDAVKAAYREEVEFKEKIQAAVKAALTQEKK
jgi:recombination protein RecA